MPKLWLTLAIAICGALAFATGCTKKSSEQTRTAAKAPMSIVEPESLVDRKEVFYRVSCDRCHTLDGSHSIGPTFKGLYGSQVPLMGGKVVTADEDYIRESILFPNAKIVKGYAPVMPSFKGLITDKDVDDLVAFIKKQK
jgi:cytochrome c2